MWKTNNLKPTLKTWIASIVLVTILSSCAAIPDGRQTSNRQVKVQEISASIQSMSPAISQIEAQQIAYTAVYYPLQLAKKYQLTKPPLIHNVLVNWNMKPRGLCYHWANDLAKELKKQNLQTVNLYWAIANKGNAAREHSSVVVTAKNHDFNSGLVLDGWRHSGILYWTPVKQDPKYKWYPFRKNL